MNDLLDVIVVQFATSDTTVGRGLRWRQRLSPLSRGVRTRVCCSPEPSSRETPQRAPRSKAPPIFGGLLLVRQPERVPVRDDSPGLPPGEKASALTFVDASDRLHIEAAMRCAGW